MKGKEQIKADRKRLKKFYPDGAVGHRNRAITIPNNKNTF